MSFATTSPPATEATLAAIKNTDGIAQIAAPVSIEDGGGSITVDGNVSIVGTSGYYAAGVTISNSAALVLAASTNRTGVDISNTGPGTLYLGPTNAVTTSGAHMGIRVVSGGTYSLAGCYTGDYYGIYSEAAASANVAVFQYGTATA